MSIRIASTDADIMDCYRVMRELRPHVAEEQFLARVRDHEKSGYRLAFVHAAEGCMAVAGFRISENLAWGRFLYVDDLVTLPAQRSKGYGAHLLSWLKGYAGQNNCSQLHLDSGMQRTGAHRFYEREGMTRAGYHFSESLTVSKS
ncbi:MAG: GNAT family N-acetyltransferase [Gammaproteobacteria bacterium]|nr:GNAT family N-acetyltransferase [Gammaproteobacteria bacterium]